MIPAAGKIRNPRFAAPRWGMLLLAGLLLGGCAASPLFQTFQSVEQRRALLRWQMPNGDGLTAEAYFSRGQDGAIAVVIGKEGPAPLLEAVLFEGTLAIRGPLTREAAWTGPVNSAPIRLAPWGALLSAYAQGASLTTDQPELHTAAYRAQFERIDGKLRRFLVQSNDTRDTFTVQF